MKPLQRFLELLVTDCANYEWIGWKRDSITIGQFTAYETIVKGFTIRICKHNYEDVIDQGYSVPRKVLRRRDIGPKLKGWIEISAHDRIFRFGRKEILSKEIFTPDSEHYESVEKIFKEVERVGHLYFSSEVTCLDAETSLLGLCDELKKREVTA